MRTRKGECYPTGMSPSKRRKTHAGPTPTGGFLRESSPAILDALPDDLILLILSKLSSSASCAADLISVLITCNRLNGLGLNSLVMSKASAKMLTLKARQWSESAHRFLKMCSDSGNLRACYFLGMIRFYCLKNRVGGASLIAKAAMGSDAAALYSLAVIQFNGSGGSKKDKDLQAGVALCARAAALGHVDALRELGHCLQDGYGVKRDVAEGRRLLVKANARELASVLSGLPPPSSFDWSACGGSSRRYLGPLLSDFGFDVPAPEAHPANGFLVEWFGGSGRVTDLDLRLCSHSGCGRPETRRLEFRRCSVCEATSYCSRACQAMDWKLRHKMKCTPVRRRRPEDVGDGRVVVQPQPVEEGEEIS